MRISDWSSDVCSSDLRASLVRASKRDRRIPMLEVKRGEARGAAFLVRFGCWDRGNGCGYRFVEMRCAHRLLPRIRMRRGRQGGCDRTRTPARWAREPPELVTCRSHAPPP